MRNIPWHLCFLLILQYQFALLIYNLNTDVQNNIYHQNQNAWREMHLYVDVLNLAKLKLNSVAKKVILQNYDNITNSTPRGNLVSGCLAQEIAAKFFS